MDFTPLAEHLPPAEVVGVLDDLFSHFDALAERYGLEKIKTIGDCYMVAAGVPSPRPDHARALARMALDMRRRCARRRDRAPGLELRIGINSGPVVAGVIGRKRFLYDLWGDAVNTASRMESHGTPGRIQITRATKELLEASSSASRGERSRSRAKARSRPGTSSAADRSHRQPRAKPEPARPPEAVPRT